MPLVVKLLVAGLLDRFHATVFNHLAEGLVRRADGEALVRQRRVEDHNRKLELSRLELVDAVHQTGQEGVGTRRVDGVIIASAHRCGCICALLCKQGEGSTVVQHQWKQHYSSHCSAMCDTARRALLTRAVHSTEQPTQNTLGSANAASVV